jgi:hypothetical protein
MMRKLPPEWSPLPVGAFMIITCGPASLVSLAVSVIDQAVVPGVFSLALGALCIFSTGEAAFHAGMRRMADVESGRLPGHLDRPPTRA